MARKETLDTKRKRSLAQAKRRKTLDEEAIDRQTAERIRHVRVVIAGLDQKKFAEGLGVSHAAVGQWEVGKGCTRYNLDKIAAKYGISRDWLFAGEGEPQERWTVVNELKLLTPDRIELIAQNIRMLAKEQQAERMAQMQGTPRGSGIKTKPKQGTPQDEPSKPTGRS